MRAHLCHYDVTCVSLCLCATMCVTVSPLESHTNTSECGTQKNLPKHSVILAFFDAEELGLQGSKFYVENTIIPIEHIKLNTSLINSRLMLLIQPLYVNLFFI